MPASARTIRCRTTRRPVPLDGRNHDRRGRLVAGGQSGSPPAVPGRGPGRVSTPRQPLPGRCAPVALAHGGDQRLGEPALPWAVPWWADTRVIYYRRDLWAQAGVDMTQAAFDTPEHLTQTLGQLQAAGVPIPWVVPTHQSRMTVHNVAGWVWGAGGDFVADDGRHVVFEQPEAQAGICAYLDLARFLAAVASAESVQALV